MNTTHKSFLRVFLGVFVLRSLCHELPRRSRHHFQDNSARATIIEFLDGVGRAPPDGSFPLLIMSGASANLFTVGGLTHLSQWHKYVCLWFERLSF